MRARLAFAGRPGGILALARGDIELGGGQSEDHGSKSRPAEGRRQNDQPEGGLWVTGALPKLDGDAWRDWWDREAPAFTGADTPATGRDRPHTEAGLPRGADLQIGRLTLGGSPWDDLHIQFKRAERGWQASFEGTQITGTLSLPDRPREIPMVANLTHLDLDTLMGDADPVSNAAGTPEPDRPQADPRQAPALRLNIEHLHWGKADLGRLELAARAQPDGLAITDLSLRGDLASASGSGSWTQGPLGPDTRLTLKGTATEPGALLRSVGYASVLDKAPAQVDLSVTWPGGPSDMALAGLTGHIRFELGAGHLLDVEPGVGRVLGILNVGALGRRLTLDFSDLFAKGYGFEAVTGDISLAAGAARINHFETKGPAADVAITGEADLKARRFNQLATVTPKISTGVAVASAVAGGPLVGAAVYLVDRVTGGAIDRIGSRQYRITGPWDAPEVKLVGGIGAAPGQGSEPAAPPRPDALGEAPTPRLAEEPVTEFARPPAKAPTTPTKPKAEAVNPFLH
jgi:uncharacterized protein YhdP